MQISMMNSVWVVERKLKSGRWAAINQWSRESGTKADANMLCKRMCKSWPKEQYRVTKYVAQE